MTVKITNSEFREKEPNPSNDRAMHGGNNPLL
jgi:hypothetical protein